MILCPVCRRPLLLAADYRGRWVVSYRTLALRSGRAAMLVCPDMGCDYVEPVRIAAAPDDAVVYSSAQAAFLWSRHEDAYEQTLGQLHERLTDLAAIYEKTGNPKVPSAVRYWRDRYRMTYANVTQPLKRAYKERAEVCLEGTGGRQYGRVTALLKHGVHLEQSDGSGRVTVQLADLSHVFSVWRLFDKRQRFDFSDPAERRPDTRPVSRPTTCVIIDGCRLGLQSVTRRGICRVETADPETARDLGLVQIFPPWYYGELPAGLVERCFRTIRFAYVKGYRMRVRSATNDPEVVQLETREMEAARALKMAQNWLIWNGERHQLKWCKLFHRDEIEYWEEKQLPRQIWEMVQEEQRRYPMADER